eukprot:gene5755-7945_t
MIPVVAWVPKGFARQRPIRYELKPEELDRLKKLASAEAENNNSTEEDLLEDSQKLDKNADEQDQLLNDDRSDSENEVDLTDLPPELKMDDYDKEDDSYGDDDRMVEDEQHTVQIMEEGDIGYAVDNDSDDDEEDIEDNMIKPTDCLLVVAMTEDEYSHLEVQLYSSEDNCLFVHHDITLPDFPLSLAWMDCPPFRLEGDNQQSIGNYIAVGTFSPVIEIWNLDVLDPLEPTASLGGAQEIKVQTKNKKKKTKQLFSPGSHEGAVMSLSWNTTYRQVLASGSADCTVKIWDITTQSCSHTFTHHTDKVQSVLWHPTEAWMLATGSFDKTVCVLDCRSGSVLVRYTVPSDVEALAWDPFCSHLLYCSLEDGAVAIIDIRKAAGNAEDDLLIFSAHGSTCSSIGFSLKLKGMMATSSIDKTVKIWDSIALHSIDVYTKLPSPRAIAYKTMNVGKLFTLQFCMDEPFLLAAAGDKGIVAVWESDEMEVIANHFGSRLTEIETSNAQQGMSIILDRIGGVRLGDNMIEVESNDVIGTNTAKNDVTDDSWMEEEVVQKDEKKKKKKKKLFKDKISK